MCAMNGCDDEPKEHPSILSIHMSIIMRIITGIKNTEMLWKQILH
jgi:hypothetical protein